MRVPRSSRSAVLLLLMLAVWGFFHQLGSVTLFDDPNEAEYAEGAREMVETGDWSNPHLNYVLFLNKPPLTYWLIGASYLAFGVNEFAARLPNALAAVGVILLLVWLGRPLFDATTGLLAGFILFATVGFFYEARVVRPDVFLTASIVGSIAAFAQLWRSERVFIVTDPLLARPHLDGSVPEPRYIVARDTERWAVSNRPL